MQQPLYFYYLCNWMVVQEVSEPDVFLFNEVVYFQNHHFE